MDTGGGTPWYVYIIGITIFVAVLILIVSLLKKAFPQSVPSPTKEAWEKRVKLTLHMHVPYVTSLFLSGSDRYPPKRLGWAFGPLYDRDYEYVGFTRGFFPFDRIPIKLINRWFRRPHKLPLLGWLVKPYLVRGRPTRVITDEVTGVQRTVKGDFSLPGPSMMIFADGFDTFQDDLYLVPNWSSITGDESIKALQMDAILSADRALADNYQQREDLLARSSPKYFETKWGKTQNIPVQQPQNPFPYSEQHPPGQ